MNHYLPAGPHPVPAGPHQGRRHNDHHYPPPIHPGQMPMPMQHLPMPGYHHSQQPSAYMPPHYRSWSQPPYPPHSMPPVQHYPISPLPMPAYPYAPHPPPLQHQPPPRPASSSTRSHTILSPTTSVNSVPIATPSRTTSTASVRPSSPPVTFRPQYRIPLPWYSMPEEKFPPKSARRRRRRKVPSPSDPLLQLPKSYKRKPGPSAVSTPQTETSVAAVPFETETASPSQPRSESDSTVPSTPSSSLPQSSTAAPLNTSTHKAASRPILAAIPLAPSVPPHPPSAGKRAAKAQEGEHSPSSSPSADTNVSNDRSGQPDDKAPGDTDVASPSSEQTSKPTSPPSKGPPKSWADLVRSSAPKTVNVAGAPPVNGSSHKSEAAHTKVGSVAAALSAFSVDDEGQKKLAFIEPRGLVNTGNMCYMNSVLQILIYCAPFYDFLDQIGKRAAHNFKSDTPLLDALIMFMREFPVIDSADSADRLRMRLKETELEQYGEPFTPEFVYDVIRRLPRFSSMRRGHQQDAEEFLGFLLEGLHDECNQVIKGTATSADSSGTRTPASAAGAPKPDSSLDLSDLPSPTGDDGWLEVGPKQKAAITRSSGHIASESPITKIFGGKLRSELRVPGLKNSVTLEPYQPLQLDIQSPQVNNIVDALRNLTRSETLHGDFNSPRGAGVTATKQVFIETLPPVLILHLKRFQYDNAGGTQKIWKNVGYPLDLEIPKEVFPPHKRAGRALHRDRYHLIGVVYHHGKNATGGHYTVDVRRQDGKEWIRLDDTMIRRIRSEDVAKRHNDGGSKPHSPVSEQHQQRADGTGNGILHDYAKADEGDQSEGEGEGEGEWKQVNGGNGSAQGGGAKKSWSALLNGKDTAPHDRSRSLDKFSIKDNKVAYILIYQRLGL
ncbi:MAG: hypothetical protein M1825_005453 [Sarcosagium campestre]|nr:MAG: hypothetical protein M1825_005453 [Sarcosagium campestre]